METELVDIAAAAIMAYIAYRLAYYVVGAWVYLMNSPFLLCCTNVLYNRFKEWNHDEEFLSYYEVFRTINRDFVDSVFLAWPEYIRTNGLRFLFPPSWSYALTEAHCHANNVMDSFYSRLLSADGDNCK